MDKRILSKILAVLLVFSLTCTNFILLAVYAKDSYAASINYEEQETSVKKTDVAFDAYFKEGDKGTHTYVSTSENEELKLYLKVKVDKGYLKNATINIEDSNFKVCDSDKLDDAVEEINEESNTIVLNQINKGADKEIEIPIKFVEKESYNLGNFAKDTNIKIKGTFVNDNAKEIEVNKDIVVNLALTEEANAYLSSKVINNGIFEKDGEKKRLVQIEVESKVEENKLPIRESNIEVKVPILGGKTPEYTSVIAKTTEGTNGNTGESFGKENYTIENGIIKIKVENTADENNNIEWKKNVTDKYIINLVYKQEEVEEIEEEVTSKLSLYNNEEKVLEGSYKNTEKLPEDSGKVILTEVESKEAISKGYMLVEGAKDTEYKEEIKLNVGYSSVVNNIKISKTEEDYEDENGKKYEAKIYYKKIEISKENLEKVLGEEGTISIMKGDTKLGEINSNNLSFDFESIKENDLTNLTEEDVSKLSNMDLTNMNQEEILAKLNEGKENLTNISLEITKPITEGILDIDVTKYIKAREYDEEIIESLDKIKTGISTISENSKEEVISETKLENPRYQITAETNKKAIATEIVNKNIGLKVILENINNTQRLYKNPTVEIEFPSYVETININSVNLFYDTEITPQRALIETKENGNKVLKLTMSGTQTKFNTNESIKGLTIIANIDLKTKSATPSIAENIKVKVLNDGEEVAETEERIRYIAPSEMVTINGMTNYNRKDEITEGKNGEEVTGELDRKSEAKTATETITIMNNYSYACGNIKILGRTPSEGNKDMETGEVLGSTFTAKMVSKIRAVSGIEEEKIKVYYSTNSEATEDIEAEGNEWTTEVTNLEEVKSYLIIVEGEMKTGDIMKFEYDVEIPEGLEKQESTYSMFKVFYTNMDGVTKGEVNTTTSPVIGATTGHEDDINVTLEADVEDGAEIQGEKVIKYIVHITNNTTKVIDNAILSVDIPDGTEYVELEYDEFSDDYNYIERQVNQYTKTLKILKPGEKIDEIFYLKTQYLIENDENDNPSSGIESLIKREDFPTDEAYEAMLEILKKIQAGDEETLDALARKEIKRADYETNEEYEEAVEQYKKELKEELNGGGDDPDIDITDEPNFTVIAKVIIGDNSYNSNSISNIRVNGDVEIKLSYMVTSGEKLKPGGTVEYSIEINKGKDGSYSNVEIQAVLPKGLKFKSSTYNYEFDEGSLGLIYDDETIESMKNAGVNFQETYDDKTTMEQDGQNITWKIDKMNNNKEIILVCEINEIEGEENENSLNITGKYLDDSVEKNAISNTVSFVVGKAKLKITHESMNKTGEITEGDEIQYIYTIENYSKYNAYDVQINDYCSEGIILGSIRYEDEEGNFYYISNGTNENEEVFDIKAGEKLKLIVSGKANYIKYNESKIISHYFKVHTDYQDLTSSTITHKVNEKKYSYKGNEKNSYSISGIAWIDNNSDGEKSSDEKLISNIQVILLNESGNIISTQTTGDNGEYTFSNVFEGKYVVAFMYDEKIYDITKYQKDGTNTNKAMYLKLNINGTDMNCGATDTIDLNKNVYNINLGLIINEKFDLSLSKSISKITVKTKEKTTTKEYDNSKLEKIEIKSKEIDGATVAIEYNITVTNEGAISGNVSKIVDYLKETDLKFNSELNAGWYLGTDGNLYNSTLKNTELKSGEKAEVKLILTKTMSEKNTGITNNMAEIYETYNKEGKDDYDSVPGNKVQNEDDMGNAEIIIGVKTGEAVYILIAVFVLNVIIIGIYEIKKRIIKGK